MGSELAGEVPLLRMVTCRVMAEPGVGVLVEDAMEVTVRFGCWVTGAGIPVRVTLSMARVFSTSRPSSCVPRLATLSLESSENR